MVYGREDSVDSINEWRDINNKRIAYIAGNANALSHLEKTGVNKQTKFIQLVSNSVARVSW